MLQYNLSYTNIEDREPGHLELSHSQDPRCRAGLIPISWHLTMSSAHHSYQDIIDDDPFPWYRFPNYPEKEKSLSHLTVNGEDPDALLDLDRQSDQHVFRGDYSTSFQPPGLERTMTCNFLHAKHPPPGLAFPTMLPPCFSTPTNFCQSTASAMKSMPQQVIQPRVSVINDNIVDSEGCKPGPVVCDRYMSSFTDSPPLTAVLHECTRPAETRMDSVEPDMEQEDSAMYSLIEDLEVLELEELQPVTSGPLIVSSEDWTPQRRSSQIQESSNDNSVLSNVSNTPERLVSNKTSNTSLNLEPDDSQS